MKLNSTSKVFIWSPMLSNVGTSSAMLGIANSLSKYAKCKVFLLDILGEFSNINDKRYYYLKFFRLNSVFPNKGNFSKIIIVIVSILSIPFLFYQVNKYKPDIIISGLVGFIPCMLKFFFKKIIIINSIQGYPHLSFFRKSIWKFLYNKSDFLITMSDKTKEEIHKLTEINRKKIFTIQNPILNSIIKIDSKKEIDLNEEYIFKKKIICSIGRLTFQKNFFELLKFMRRINYNFPDEFNLIILGEGELYNNLDNYIKKNNLNNCYLLGYKKNPYRYLSRAKLYISTSLWEDPGHTLIEAGYLNIPILSSDCPNGPNEIIKNNFNGFKYKLNDEEDFIKKFKEYYNTDKKKIFELKKNMKKEIKKYSAYRFYNSFCKMIG